MTFCTQCGNLLQDGQACVCTATPEEVFCTQCGEKLKAGQVCICAKPATPEPPPTPPMPKRKPPTPKPPTIKRPDPIENTEPPTDIPAYPRRPFAEEPTITDTMKANFDEPDMPVETASLVPDYIAAIKNEEPIRQYHIANMRNFFRMTRAAGMLQITNKRVIFRAESHALGRTTATQREHAIEGIAGLDVASSYRLSISRLALGLVTMLAAAALVAWAVFWLTHGGMLPTNEYVVNLMRPPTPSDFMPIALFYGMLDSWPAVIDTISLAAGLVAGFGGIALFFILRGKFWVKQILMGVSVGGYIGVALTYNVYAFVLLVLSLVLAAVGLVMFAWLPDLVVIIRSKSGGCIPLVCARRPYDAWRGTMGLGYAEVAPAAETLDAVNELGAIIRDIQAHGVDGVRLWQHK